MKNFVKWFDIIALIAVIGFSFAACGGDDGGGGGGGGGGFTLTGIPSQYNGKYALIPGFYAGTEPVQGAQSFNMSTHTVTLCLISNGSVNIPLWTIELRKYSGNGTASNGLGCGIYNSQTLSMDDNDGFNNYLAQIGFFNVTFSNGGATRAWSQGQLVP